VFWQEKVAPEINLTPNRDWIPSAVADFLKAGTRDDNKAYSPDLLSRAWALIKILLQNTDAAPTANGSDPMSQALNTQKGRVIEALFNHALRACRLNDRADGQHKNAWLEMKSVFDIEFDKSRSANFEFSTLSGMYIANLDYVDHEWLRSKMESIFPSSYPDNFKCALEGLAYAPARREIYDLLSEFGVIEKALALEDSGRYAREKIIERIAIAYLWGIDELESPRFSYFFDGQHAEDLEQAAHFFWSVSGEKLLDNQKELILSFWDRCVAWSDGRTEPPKSLLSKLSLLSCYLKTVGEREANWLYAVAPYVQVGYNADNFIKELGRLADSSPKQVSKILGRVLEFYSPSYDYEDRLKHLLTKLASSGERNDVIGYTERLRHLPGMTDFYSQLMS
jgi:hypothetical protein